MVGVPAEALRVSRQHLRNAVKGVADSLMIVSEPFAVAYGMDALLHTMIIDIGAGTTDFCVMKGRYPTDEDQRTLTSAGDSVDEQLAKLIRAKAPDAQFSIHMVRAWKEAHSFVGEPKRPVEVTVPVKGKPTAIDITAEMRRACESLLPPIVETMLDLISKVEPEYQENVRQQRHPRRRRLAGPGPREGAPGGARRGGRRQGHRRRRPDLRGLERLAGDRDRRAGIGLGEADRLTRLPSMVTHDPTPGSSGKVPLVSEVLDRLVAQAGGETTQRSAMFQAALQVCTEELRRVKKGAKPATLATLVERARYLLVVPAGRARPEPVEASAVLAAAPASAPPLVPTPPNDTTDEAPTPSAPTPDAQSAKPLGDVIFAPPETSSDDPFPLAPDAVSPDHHAAEPWPPPPPRAVFEDLFAEMRVNLAEDDGEAAPESGGRAGRIALAVGATVVVAAAAAWFFFVRSARGPAVPDAAPAVIAQIPASSDGRAPREPTADVAAAAAVVRRSRPSPRRPRHPCRPLRRSPP